MLAAYFGRSTIHDHAGNPLADTDLVHILGLNHALTVSELHDFADTYTVRTYEPVAKAH